MHPASPIPAAADCGRYMNSLYEQARKAVADFVGAEPEEYAVIFTGSGSTGAIDKLARALLGQQHLQQQQQKKAAGNTSRRRLQGLLACGARQQQLEEEELPVVFVGPHEHHSNEVLWREQRCIVRVRGGGH